MLSNDSRIFYIHVIYRNPMKSSYFSDTGAGAKVPATQLALARLVVVVLLLVALVAAACNS